MRFSCRHWEKNINKLETELNQTLPANSLNEFQKSQNNILKNIYEERDKISKKKTKRLGKQEK